MPYVQTGPNSRKWVEPRESQGGFFERKQLTGGETARTAIEEVADFKAPTYDLDRIQELTQEQLAPTITAAKRGVRTTQAGRYANPIARKLAIEGAIEATGRDISAGQAQATRTATSLYAPEYQGKMQEAIFNYKKALADAELARKAEEREQREATTIRRGGGATSGETYRQALTGLERTMARARKTSPASWLTKTPTSQDYTNQIVRGTKKRYALPEGDITPTVLSPASEPWLASERRI